MIALLRKRNGRLLGPHSYLQARAACVDREVLVAQPPHDVERRPRRLLLGQAQCVLLHRRLDRRAYLRRRAEEPIGRREALKPLVRPLEVVVLHEQRRSPLTVVEVRKDGARQELLPHRLPEALNLAARLRVMRPALHVPDAMAAKLLLESRLATPRRVLAPLVGEDLARRPVVRDPARERLHHQRAPLMVRHHQAHQVARVIIQERRHVHPLVFPEQKREEVRLPQLIGLRALEAPLLRLGLRPRRLALVRNRRLRRKHPAHRRLGGPDAKEAREHITNAPAPRLRVLSLHRKHRGCAVTHRPARSGR